MKSMRCDEIPPDRLTERIIACAFTVANTLGVGFIEKVYENALAHEMRKYGLTVAQQRGIIVQYDGAIVGEYAADLLVEETVIVELEHDCFRLTRRIQAVIASEAKQSP